MSAEDQQDHLYSYQPFSIRNTAAMRNCSDSMNKTSQILLCNIFYKAKSYI